MAENAKAPLFQDHVELHRLQKDTEGFLKVAEVLKSMTGIHLPPNDKNLVLMAGRLVPLFREQGFSSYAEFLEWLRSNPGSHADFISAMTTNTTEFFRERSQFDALPSLLPEVLKAKGPCPELRVWCAASSTGQEVYTIAMRLDELKSQVGDFQLKMLATDIDLEVLGRAADGIYTEAEIASLPAEYQQRYMVKGSLNGKTNYRVRNTLREQIQFAQFNLLQSPYPFKHSFDLVFCRNVLIYFDRVTAEAVVDKLARTLAIQRLLFLGLSETGIVRNANLQSVRNAIYRRKS